MLQQRRPTVDGQLVRRVSALPLLAALAGVGAAGAQARAPKTAPRAAGNWSIETSTSKMDDSRIVVLSTAASAPIEGWLQKARPSLYVRCSEGELSVFVRTGLNAQPELGQFQHASVRYRIDDAGPVSESWSEATNGVALFAPEPRALVQAMISARRLRFEFTPFNSNRVLAEFTITGLASPVRQVFSACPEPDTSLAPHEREPEITTRPTGAAPIAEGGIFGEFQVERQVTVVPGNAAPRHPDMLRRANVDGEVLAQFVVDTLGRAEMSTFRVLKSTHDLFTNSVKAALPDMKFTPAEAGGRHVRQLVQMPFEFTLKKP